MKNFIFKSSARTPDLQKIVQVLLLKINLIQKEQRAARLDLAAIKLDLTKLLNTSALQKQVDDFYDGSDRLSTDEPSA